MFSCVPSHKLLHSIFGCRAPITNLTVYISVRRKDITERVKVRLSVVQLLSRGQENLVWSAPLVPGNKIWVKIRADKRGTKKGRIRTEQTIFLLNWPGFYLLENSTEVKPGLRAHVKSHLNMI